MSPEMTQSLVYSFLSSEQVAAFERDLELDLSFGIDGLGRQVRAPRQLAGARGFGRHGVAREQHPP